MQVFSKVEDQVTEIGQLYYIASRGNGHTGNPFRLYRREPAFLVCSAAGIATGDKTFFGITANDAVHDPAIGAATGCPEHYNMTFGVVVVLAGWPDENHIAAG